MREEFNRAEQLRSDKRTNTVGFALTVLQRRLASSPEAIYQSLRRRRERLEGKLAELELLQRSALVGMGPMPTLDADDLEDLDEAPEDEVEAKEEEILDQATAARTIAELRAEIATLERAGDAGRRQSAAAATDTKWRELTGVLTEIFTPAAIANRLAETGGRVRLPATIPQAAARRRTRSWSSSPSTATRSTTCRRGSPPCSAAATPSSPSTAAWAARSAAKMQESFKHDPDVQVLLATDAAGEGINLQRAHLMVNYDLPWNPNRLEQRFGRIHRIGQTEVCHLWNLVAEETREGEVYRGCWTSWSRRAPRLGGQVFDVLGKLQFEGKPLRDLLIEAIRYGDQPEVRARLTKALDQALDRRHLADLMEDNALARDSMDASRVFRIREEMERAEARRLQPHYIQSFFTAAFERLGGTLRKREPQRFEITNVPAAVRNRDRLIGTGDPVLPRYERITFEKELVAPPGQPLAAFVCPGHPLLDAVVDLTLERNRDLLKRGTVLVDERDHGTQPRVLFFLEHAIQDAGLTQAGDAAGHLQAHALRRAGRAGQHAPPALRPLSRLPPAGRRRTRHRRPARPPRGAVDHARAGEPRCWAMPWRRSSPNT